MHRFTCAGFIAHGVLQGGILCSNMDMSEESSSGSSSRKGTLAVATKNSVVLN